MNWQKYIEIENSEQGMTSKIMELKEIGLEWYKSEVIKHFELKNFPSLSCDDKIIEQILGGTQSDARKKRINESYYRANAVAYMKVMERLVAQCDDIFPSIISSENPNLVYNYYSLINDLLLDSLVLINDYASYVKEKQPPYGLFKNEVQHTRQIYDSLVQALYGQQSLHSYMSMNRDISISIIRQLVEIRIRRAFGTIRLVDKNKKSEIVLPMSELLKIIGEYKNDIDFSIPFNCLARIYGWSNIFLHTGIKEYRWKPVFICGYLNVFSKGRQQQDIKQGFNINSGINFKQDTFDKIILKLEQKFPHADVMPTDVLEAIVN